jgi:hypothetical protein
MENAKVIRILEILESWWEKEMDSMGGLGKRQKLEKRASLSLLAEKNKNPCHFEILAEKMQHFFRISEIY